MDIRIPQKLERSCRSLGSIPAGDTGLPTPGLGGPLVRRGATTTSETEVTAKRRQRSAAGWAAGSRSTLIVLMKPGNWSRRTRWREGKTERGCLVLDPGPRNTSEASYLEPRITVTTQDSNPGIQRFGCMANPASEEPDALCGAQDYVAPRQKTSCPEVIGPNGRHIKRLHAI